MAESTDIPHYFAICRSNDGTPFVTNALYPSEEAARLELRDPFLRLAKELPPFYISPKEVALKEAQEKASSIHRRLTRGRLK